MPESAYERARRHSTPVEEFTGDQYKFSNVHPDDVTDSDIANVYKTAIKRHGDFLEKKYGGKDPGFSETSSYTNN